MPTERTLNALEHATPSAAGNAYFISSEIATEVLDLPGVIEQISRAYAAPAGAAANPSRIVARGDRVWLRCLASIPASGRLMGAKIFALGPERSVNYVITLFDKSSGKIVAFVDALHITAIRTAATSAAALSQLAPPGPVSVAVLGSGLEAQTHLRALRCVRSLKDVRIFSPTKARRDSFARAAQAEYSVECRSFDDARHATSGAQIVVAAARSYGEEPILRRDWVGDEVTIVSIGSTLPEQRELDVSVIDAADIIVCDSVEEVSMGTGDMIAAREAGVDFSSKIRSLNALMAGEVDVLGSKLRLFKSVGSALQDVVVAELALSLALERGIAMPLPFSFHTKMV
jgi:ornithine cyclodeaminase/alanine dehydrogenase